MPGNMNPASNVPGGRYAERDDRTRPSQVLYSPDDEPQIVASCIVMTGEFPALVRPYNILSVVGVAVEAGLRFTLPPFQAHANYVVDAAWNGTELLGTDNFPHLLVANRTLTTFDLFARYETGASLLLAGVDTNPSPIGILVRRALVQRRTTP
jgi:hypothetical protein